MKKASISISKDPGTLPNGFLLLLLACILLVAFEWFCQLLKYRFFVLDSTTAQAKFVMGLVGICLLVIPLTFFVLMVIARFHFGPWMRSLIVLSPALLMAAPAVIGAALAPDLPAPAFAKRMGSPVPEDVSGFKAWFSHSPGESGYMFTFRCGAESTEELISAGELRRIEGPGMLDLETGAFFSLPIGNRYPPDGWPEPKSWTGLEVYSANVPGGYRYLLTNASKTQVFILVGDT